jgi:hypothetical protein
LPTIDGLQGWEVPSQGSEGLPAADGLLADLRLFEREIEML